MVWIDLKEVVKENIDAATVALARAEADSAVSRDIVESLTRLRAATIAIAKIAGVGIFDDEPTTR